MKTKCLFSVIIPTYNRSTFLVKAINSVIVQTFTDWELIIVDDGSTDNTKEVVKSFTDARVKYIYQENKERSAARNTGIQNAIGEYICFLDSDDYCLPDFLSSFLQVIKDHKFPVAMIYCNSLQDIGGEVSKIPPPLIASNNAIEFVLLNPIGVQRMCIYRGILSKYQFNERFRIGEDVELWVRILREYPLIYNPDYITVLVFHEGRSVMSSDIEFHRQNIESKNYIIENVKGLISRKVNHQVMSRCWLGLAKSYKENNMTFKYLSSLIRSIWIAPTYQSREKLFLLLDEFFVTRLFLKLFRTIKNISAAR